MLKSSQLSINLDYVACMLLMNLPLFFSTIRQQLTNTEDIRRVRKKAPCTRPEISTILRQCLEDEIFSEPIFTGEFLLSSAQDSIYL